MQRDSDEHDHLPAMQLAGLLLQQGLSTHDEPP
jgi:hypothetical protein